MLFASRNLREIRTYFLLCGILGITYESANATA